MGEFGSQVGLNYIDLWVTHYPDTLQDLIVPVLIPKLAEYIDHEKQAKPCKDRNA